MAEPNNQPDKQTGKKRRWILFLVLGVLFITGSVMLYLIYNAEELAKDLLIEQLNEQLAPNAVIKIGEFSFSVHPTSITLNNVEIVHIKPFEEIEPVRKTDSILRFEFREATVEGINLLRLALRRQWSLGMFTVDGLHIETVPFPEDSGDKPEDPDYVFPLFVSEVTLKNSRFTSYRDREATRFAYMADNFMGKLYNFSLSKADAPLHSYMDHVAITADTLGYMTDDELYEIFIINFETDSRAQALSFSKAEVIPQKTAKQMAEKIGTQTDQFNIETGALKATGFDIITWLKDEELKITSLIVDKPILHINRDKSFPRADRGFRPLPPKQFIELPYGISIDTLKMENATIRYVEKYPQDGRSGEISFYEVDVLAKKLQNRSDQDSIRVYVTARFLNEVPIAVNYHFAVRENSGHAVSGHMGSFDLTLLNPVIENLAAKQIRSGMLDDFRFDFHANNYSSTGKLHMVYNNFELRFLDEESLEETRGRRLRSFLANRLKIRAANSADDPRQGEIDFERDEERSIFNYWWKSVLSGIEDIVIR